VPAADPVEELEDPYPQKWPPPPVPPCDVRAQISAASARRWIRASAQESSRCCTAAAATTPPPISTNEIDTARNIPQR
jgi:hypothetical protein